MDLPFQDERDSSVVDILVVLVVQVPQVQVVPSRRRCFHAATGSICPL